MDGDTETLWEEFMSHELSLEQEAKRLAVLARREMLTLKAPVAKKKAQNKYARRKCANATIDHRGPCEICGRIPGPTQRSNAFDHDHKTGEFRGWLCGRCNIGLGYFKDSTEALEKAIAYLIKKR